MWDEKPVPCSTSPVPHDPASWGAKITLVLHLFLFTKTFVLKDFKFENFYDNWKGKDSGVMMESADEGFVSTLASLSMTDVLNEMSIVTNDMLADTVEFQIDGVASN